MKNLFFDLPTPLQEKIMEMKKEIEKSEFDKGFYDHLRSREIHNKEMDVMNETYADVKMPFGKFKNMSIRGIAEIRSSFYQSSGTEYLQWLSNNVDIKDQRLKECIEFYKNYYYHHGDGCD